VTRSMSTIGAEEIRYSPPVQVERLYVAKKVISLLLCGLGGVFFLWYVWDGVTSPPSLDFDYITMIGIVFMGFVALGFLIVIIWNERLARIEDGRLTWPFPFMRESGARTRYIALGEIADAELTADSSGRRGAALTLRDGTRLFLPRAVFGVDYSELLQVLARHAKGRSFQGSSEVPERGRTSDPR